jgi:hypothetical protein
MTSASRELPITPSLGKLVFELTYSQDGGYSVVRDVFVVNADGTGILDLMDDTTYDFDPVWSPDGQEIALVSFREKDGQIFVVRPDGSGIRQVTNVEEGVSGIERWSVDGSKIYFYSNNGVVINVTDRYDWLCEDFYELDLSSAKQTKLPRDCKAPLSEQEPTSRFACDTSILPASAQADMVAVWLPDCSQVAYVVRGPSVFTSRLYVMNQDKSANIVVWEPEDDDLLNRFLDSGDIRLNWQPRP